MSATVVLMRDLPSDAEKRGGHAQFLQVSELAEGIRDSAGEGIPLQIAANTGPMMRVRWSQCVVCTVKVRNREVAHSCCRLVSWLREAGMVLERELPYKFLHIGNT